MEKIVIYILLLIVFIIMTVKNIMLMRRNSQAKKCNEYCQAILNDKEDAYLQAEKYIKSCKNDMFSNKVRLFLILHDINDTKIDQDLLEIDIKSLFYKNNKFNKNNYIFNSDTFIWLSLIMCKAYYHNNNKLIIKLLNLFKNYENDFIDYLEYSVFLKGIKNAFVDSDSDLLMAIINNEQNGYKYNPKYLDLYMVISEIILVSTNLLERNEIINNHITSFSKTNLGKIFLRELHLEI